MVHRFYLSTYWGTEHAMGNMLVILSDTHLTREDSSYFRRTLNKGDVVLCECEPRENGVYTLGIAKVEAFAADGKTPTRIANLLGEAIQLTGVEEIIDHREGHTLECACGV